MAKDSRELTDVLLSNQKKYKPSKKVLSEANVKNYEAELKRAAKNPIKFWEEAANELHWFKKWDKVFDDKKKPFYKWFTGAKCNLAYNALDRHIENSPKMHKKLAIIWEEESGRVRKYTYLELYKEVNKLVNALKKLGVDRGDRVAIYMPNIPEIVFAMLACAKIGAMHSVVYAGFSSQALADRIDDASAKVVFTADGSFRRGKEILLKPIVDEALKLSKEKNAKTVIVTKNNKAKVEFNKKIDVWYHDFVKGFSEIAHCAEMDAEDPAFVLYTSGTTSKPKGVIHVHGGYPVNVLRTMKYVWDIKGDEIYWCTADPGWITGHSYIIYGPLLAGITTLMYEGVPDMPKPDRIWRVIEKYKVNILYTAPTLIRAMMKYGAKWPQACKMPSLRLLGSVGEPINPEAWKWFYKYVGKNRCPIMDTWWQTETGANMLTPLPSASLKAGSACKPFPGIIADVVDKKGKSVPVGKGGYLVIKNQWPSMIRTIFNNPKRYIKTYWSEVKGAYFAGDVAFKDKDGYFWIQGRTDDVLKVAGHRIGTAEVESSFVSHQAVVEAAVIGVPDPVKGEVIVAFVTLAGKQKPSEALQIELKKHVRKGIGPVAVIKDIKFIDKLPKTRSGKIMRRVLKAKELGQDVGDTSAMIK
ncbi:MAG: acetate--CoA ligase [Patescibacteria group bacterium]|nr:acetate--CoA ligase [Patescibacteria group bacterium]